MQNKTVYGYHPQTGEYTGETIAQRSPLDTAEVYLIPAWAAETPPPAAGQRQAASFRAADGTVPSYDMPGSKCKWQLLPDLRGLALWKKTSAQPVVAQLGDTTDSLGATELEPPQFGVWDGKGWMVNEAAQLAALTAAAENEIATRRAFADAVIVPLQDAADLGMATPEEAGRLTALRRYRVELSRVTQQQGYPGKIKWPVLPS